MATLVFGVVGRAVLGPIGGLIGTIVGSGVDRRLFGGGRQAGRQATPEIQAASYGEPIPFVRGRMRVSGNVIWASPVRESVSRSGGGKRGPATTSCSYSASFAVLLCAGAISGVGRVWADGKLMRDANGQWLIPATMRIHGGSERQAVDPLIAVAEGEAPAFRGLAYVVFEDLALAEFGNRLPNLSFELLAGEGPVNLGQAVAELAGTAGVRLDVAGEFTTVAGLYVGSASSLSDVMAPVLRYTGSALSGGAHLVGSGGVVKELDPAGEAQSAAGGDDRATGGDRDRQRRLSVSHAPDAVEISYYDVDRDYQAGLQRSRLKPGERIEGGGLPVALDAAAAKRLCTDMLVRLAAGRQQRTLRLPWRFLGMKPGDRLALPDGLWRVRELRFETFVISLDLVRVAETTPPSQVSDGGRGLLHGDAPAGPSRLEVMDLPPLPGELPDRPRLLIAGAGAAPGWRRAGVMVSLDGGASYALAGVIPAPLVMGSALTALPPANPAGWDEVGSVDVALLSEGMWLEGRERNSVLAGANLAVLGREIIQYRRAAPIGPGRFRLSGLLRGRRGSEWAVADHVPGERFVLLDPASLLELPLPLERLGETILVRAAGSGDVDALPLAVPIGGEAVRPLRPVHLRSVKVGGELHFSWIPQSRAGFGWPDLADVPLGEAQPAWRVTLRDAVGQIETATVEAPAWECADRPGPLWLDVAQVGATLGRTATLAIA